MNNQDIEDILVACQKVLPFVCKRWNEEILPKFEDYLGVSYREHFSGVGTQEITKQLTSRLDRIYIEEMRKVIEELEITEEKKKDYTFRKRLSLESKNTLSTSNSWTGNGYPKCNWHILFKYDLNKDGIIKRYLACLAPLQDIMSGWTTKTQKSNFVSLRFYNEDYDKILMIAGDWRKTTTKNSLYLAPIFVDYVSPT